MPQFLVPRYADPQVDSLQGITGVYGYQESSERISFITRFTTAPLVNAEALANIMEPVTDMKLKNLVAVTHDNAVNLEVKPDSVPRGQVLKFRVRLASMSTTPELPDMTLSQYIPAATFESAEELKTVGEAIAALMLADSNISKCDYVESRAR